MTNEQCETLKDFFHSDFDVHSKGRSVETWRQHPDAGYIDVIITAGSAKLDHPHCLIPVLAPEAADFSAFAHVPVRDWGRRRPASPPSGEAAGLIASGVECRRDGDGIACEAERVPVKWADGED